MEQIVLNVPAVEEFPWKRNLYVLWVAQFIAMIGMSGCVPFLPLYIRKLGVTDATVAQWWSGVIYSAPFFVSVFVTPIWGALGDRYSRKLMVIRALFGLTIAMFLMGFAQNVWQLFFLRCLQGAISGFIASNLALVSASTPQEHSGYAIGFLQTSVSAGATVGPMIGGMLSDAIGIRFVFFVVAFFSFISQTIIIFFVREKRTPPSSKHVPLQKNLSILWKNANLRHFLLFITLSQAGIVFPAPIFAYYVEFLQAPQEYLGTITGVMVGIVGLLMTVSGPIWGKRTDQFGHQKTLLIVLPMISIAVFLQSVVSYYTYLFPLRVIIGIFSAGLIPTLYAVLNKNSPAQIQGIVMGFASSATMLGNLVGPMFCSLVSSNLGMRWAFVAGGGLIGIVYFQILLQSLRGIPLIDCIGKKDMTE